MSLSSSLYRQGGVGKSLALGAEGRVSLGVAFEDDDAAGVVRGAAAPGHPGDTWRGYCNGAKQAGRPHPHINACSVANTTIALMGGTFMTPIPLYVPETASL